MVVLVAVVVCGCICGVSGFPAVFVCYRWCGIGLLCLDFTLL